MSAEQPEPAAALPSSSDWHAMPGVAFPRSLQPLYHSSPLPRREVSAYSDRASVRLPWRGTGSGMDAAASTVPPSPRSGSPRTAEAGRRTALAPLASPHEALPPHTPHNVTVVHVNLSPRVRLLRDFLTNEEAAEILKIATPLFHRSPVRSVATDRRTSHTATLTGGLLGNVNWAVKAVRERISAFSGYHDGALEPLQVVRYYEGEKYEPHHDLFDLCDFPQRPRRHLTFLIYLNDMEDGAGGDTTFPRLNLYIKPEKNTAIPTQFMIESRSSDLSTSAMMAGGRMRTTILNDPMIVTVSAELARVK